MDAIFHVVRTGCACRQLPHDLLAIHVPSGSPGGPRRANRSSYRYGVTGPVGDDLRMERVIDLDGAASAIADRQPAWQAAGLLAEPVTWRDEAAPWPRQLTTERSRINDPDSVGIHLHGLG